MSSRRILSICFALSLLLLIGCSESVLEPESPLQQDEIGSIAQGPDSDEARYMSQCYFPMNVGDRWIYRLDPATVQGIGGDWDIQEITVTGSYRMGDRQVFRLDNYAFPFLAGELTFYSEQPGLVMEVADNKVGLWYPWCEFRDEVHRVEIADLAIDCIHGTQGLYVGKDTVTVPAGVFDQAATIVYDSAPCADFELVREVFAPGIGLVERTRFSMSGNATWQLVYANVGGQEWGTPPQL